MSHKPKFGCFLSFLISWGGIFLACKDGGNPVDVGENLLGKIVFTSSRTGTSQIYVMNAGGSGIQQLTFFQRYQAYTPRSSPDGKRVVFTSDSLATSLGTVLYLMNADGSDMRPLKEFPPPTREAPPFYQPGSWPAWSPDGNKIAFSWCVDCELFGKNQEIFVIDLITGDMIQVTNDPGADFQPSWGSDQRTIGFISDRDFIRENKQGSDLYTITLPTQETNRITNSASGASNSWLRFRPNSSMISFVSYDTLSQSSNVFLFNPIDKKTVELTKFKLVSSTCWSPDGVYLALRARLIDERFFSGIVDTTGQITLVFLRDDPLAKDFDWSANK